MTRKEAIENHRKMWNWIADETERQQRVITKWKYFAELFNELYLIGDIPMCLCYCCEYDFNEHMSIAEAHPCKFCPISFGSEETSKKERTYCTKIPESPYTKWVECNVDWQKAAEYAREIANLPERFA